MNLILTRTSDDGVRTLGNLLVDGHGFATIERPWIVNPKGPGGMPRLSCVPPGMYSVQPHDSAKFPQTYAIVNNALGVYLQPYLIPPGQPWGRSAILLHIGNFSSDVIGCIAIGKEHGVMLGQPAVIRSGVAMRELNALLKRGNHSLEIT